MAFDFPASPTDGQLYTPPNGPTYQYQTPRWMVLSGAALPAPQGWRNRIINGDFAIDQRNNGGAVTPPVAVDGYSVDRWFTVASLAPGLVTAQRVLDATLREYALSLTVATADNSLAAADLYVLRHNIEGYNIRDFQWGTPSAKPITISFDVKGNAAYTLSLALRNPAAFTRMWLGSFPVTTSWSRVTMTVPGDTSGVWEIGNLAGLNITVALGAGSGHVSATPGWQAGSLSALSGTSNFMAAVSNNIQIKNFQLEVGSVATEFERVDYSEQLRRCQRYYEVVDGLVNTTTGTTSRLFPFKANKRAAPTLGTPSFGTGTGGTFIAVNSAPANTQHGGIVCGANHSAQAYFSIVASAEL